MARTAFARLGGLLVLAMLLGLFARALTATSAARGAVAWSPSTGVVVGEVMTRGAAASDQYAELYNAASVSVALGGLELDYVTASGATTTVKQTWSDLVMPPGAHLLIANAAGSYAEMADGTFSGGFSTVGGTLLVRDSGSGSVIDALSWGSAANGFVEGAPGQAPPTGSSLERLPGAGSNWTDTNDNAADAFVQSVPLAQNLSSPPQPAPSPSTSPAAAACGTAPATGTPTFSPLDSATATPIDTPTLTPSPTVTPSTPTPTAAPTAEPPMAIRDARAQSEGATVVVEGTVTVGPGWILGDTTLGIADQSGGIYVRLPAPADVGPGDIVRVEGVLAAPYGNLEIRPATDGLTVVGHGPQVAPRDLDLGELGEPTEGLLARVEGTVASISAGSSGSVTVMLGDASGTGRVFVFAVLGLGAGDFVRGERLSVAGLVGDRLGLYRLWPRSRDDIDHLGGPAPTATPPAVSAEPTAAPAAKVSIAEALRRMDEAVTVEGTVSVRTGLLDSDGRRVTIQDGTAAILVRLPDNETTAVGDRIRVTGVMGTYYGAPQLAADSMRGISRAALSPLLVRSAPLTAALEWRLITVSGEIDSVTRDGDTWRAELTLDDGAIPVSRLSRSGIPATALQEGHEATITGLVKRAYPTASDQRFAVVPRGTSDIVLGRVVASAAPASSSSAQPTLPVARGAAASDEGSASSDPAGFVALRDLPAHAGEAVAVGGRVVATGDEAITIVDDSGSAVLVLSGSATDLAGAIIAGDLLNAVGIVVDGLDGSPAIAITDARNITRLGQLGTASPAPSPSPSPMPSLFLAAVPPVLDAASPGSSGPLWLALIVALMLVGLGTLALARPRVRGAVRQRFADIRTRLAATRTTRPKRGTG